MAFLKVDHLACPKCKSRQFVVTRRTSYKDVLPIVGEEADSAISFTCFGCGSTYPEAFLAIAGTYDPAKELEERLASG